MSKSSKALGLAVGALALTCLPAAAQTKVTNEGISANEIVIGTHQDLSGPIKGWGVPVSNGMKMAVEEINAAGGIQGRKIKLIVEDSGYDPKKAVLASQKMVERDKIFAMVGPMGSPTVQISCRARSSDRKSTRLNSSHLGISYAVFCLKKKIDNPTTVLIVRLMFG